MAQIQPILPKEFTSQGLNGR